MLFKSKKALMILMAVAIPAAIVSGLAAYDAMEDHPAETETELLKEPGPDAINIFDGTKISTRELEEKINLLSNVKKQEYAKWVSQGNTDIGYYKRKIQQILNDEPATKRITLPEVNAIIADHHGFIAQLSEIEKVHGDPDFIGGSGITRLEFWLNDQGTDKIIVLMEQGDIFHGTNILNR